MDSWIGTCYLIIFPGNSEIFCCRIANIENIFVHIFDLQAVSHSPSIITSLSITLDVCTYLAMWLRINWESEIGRFKLNGGGKHAAAPYRSILCITFIPLILFCWTICGASNYMHRGPHAWSWALSVNA